jgi:soluble lytic murein transglycosylase
LLAEQPYSYYGFRALDLLAADGSHPAPGARPLPPGAAGELPGTMRALPGHARALRLERAGLTDLAGSEFLALHDGNGDPPPALVLRVARAYASTRWAYRGVRLMRGAFRDWENVAVEGGEPEGFRSALYPRPFRDLYEREAGSRDMDAGLALAISRQESLFDPEIRSWAGAVGLMQLMPETAAMEARKLGLPRPGDDDLADPALNVQLGIHHLDGLLERFGSVPAAVAAYNAGGGRVKKWLADRPLKGEGAVSEDLWIDTIPITQTRLYVKAVLRALEEYRRQDRGR